MAAATNRGDWPANDSPYRDHKQRGPAQAELNETIATWTASFGTDELLAVLGTAGIPPGANPCRADTAGDPRSAARHMIVDVPGPGLGGEEVPMPGVLPKLGALPGVDSGRTAAWRDFRWGALHAE